MEMFQVQYATLHHLPLSKPYPTHQRHVEDLMAAARRKRQRRVIYDCELSEWYKYLVKQVSVGCVCVSAYQCACLFVLCLMSVCLSACLCVVVLFCLSVCLPACLSSFFSVWLTNDSTEMSRLLTTASSPRGMDTLLNGLVFCPSVCFVCSFLSVDFVFLPICLP